MEKNKISLLTFHISGTCYSIKTTKIAEVIQQPNVVFLPTPVQHFAGVIYYNNDFIPILDMHKHLINGPAIASHTNSIIIINMPHHTHKKMIAILVDEIKDIVTVDVNHIFNLEYTNINTANQMLTGIFKHKNKTIHLIDIEALYPQHAPSLKQKNVLVHEI
jgi:chemotaxis signal transduction protein